MNTLSRVNHEPLKEFPTSVTDQVDHYVYLLIDPITGRPFYVGKGKRNRMFQHEQEAIDKPRSKSARLQRIIKIKAKGKEIEYKILRHGLTKEESIEVEAAIIDFIGLPKLTNKVVGHDAEKRGLMTVSEIIAQYYTPAVTIQEPAILIIVNKLYKRNISPAKLYEITRGNWTMGPRRNKAKYAFAVYHGVVRQVYKIKSWELVPYGRPDSKRKDGWRFEGEIAHDMQRYVGNSVTNYIARGAQNPIKYVNCRV